MDHYQFANARLEQGTSRVFERNRIQSAVGFPNAEPGGLARFDFVENAIIYELDNVGRDEFAQTCHCPR